MKMLWWCLTQPRYCFRMWRLYGIPPWQVYREVKKLCELHEQRPQTWVQDYLTYRVRRP